MEHSFHPFHELFVQLGLDDDAEHIEAFLQTHSLAQDVALADAPFWSPGQADFLRTALQADSDWSSVVDALNAALHN
jgi:hypothetical protein